MPTSWPSSYPVGLEAGAPFKVIQHLVIKYSGLSYYGVANIMPASITVWHAAINAPKSEPKVL